MKSVNFSLRSFLAIFLLVGIAVVLGSWGLKQTGERYKQSPTDTVPTKKSDKEKKIRDLDDVLNELDNADMNFNNEEFAERFKEGMKYFDGDRIRKDIENALKNIDMEKIHQQIESSMNKVDWDKMNDNIKDAMESVNWDKIKHDYNESVSRIDMSKIKLEIDKAMKGIDWDKMQNDLKEMKGLNFDKMNESMKQVEENLKNLGPELEKAKVHLEKAKAEIREYKVFVNGLESDGLIDKKQSYSLKHKNGELQVNGKKVSEEIYNKYRSFLEKHPKFSIEKDEDDFDIDLD